MSFKSLGKSIIHNKGFSLSFKNMSCQIETRKKLLKMIIAMNICRIISEFMCHITQLWSIHMHAFTLVCICVYMHIHGCNKMNIPYFIMNLYCKLRIKMYIWDLRKEFRRIHSNCSWWDTSIIPVPRIPKYKCQRSTWASQSDTIVGGCLFIFWTPRRPK